MMRVRRKRWTAIWMIGALSLSAWMAQASDVVIQHRNESARISSRRHQGVEYYRITEIAATLGLGVVERGELLFVTGPRGEAQLIGNRPLVRFRDQYILISAPAWTERSGAWFVPEDFLTKIVPLLLESKLRRTADHRYRLDVLRENRVRVEVVNYPDHVSIIFLPGRRAPIRVQEFSRHIRVEFGEYLVTPIISETEPDSRIVTALRFDSGDVFGSFDIVKGQRYATFRHYNLSDPERKVVDLYSRPVAATDEEALPSSDLSADPPADLPTVPDSAPVFQRQEESSLVTIDAGHGGQNYGVRMSQEVLEKDFALQIARQVELLLMGAGQSVALTRTRDIDLPVDQRSAIANRNRSRAFISVHLGGSHRAEKAGPQVYYYARAANEIADRTQPSERRTREGSRPQDSGLAQEVELTPWESGQLDQAAESRRLALLVQRELNRVFGTRNTVDEAPLAVLAPVQAPAILVEAGYLTNSVDLNRLRDPFFQRRIAEAVSAALLDFLL